ARGPPMPTALWKSQFQVNTSTLGNQSPGSAIAFSDDKFAVVFNSGDGASVARVRKFAADGTPEGNDIVVASSGQLGESSATFLSSGDALAVWHGSTGEVRARYITGGNTPGNEFVAIQTAAGAQSWGKAAQLTDDSLVFVARSTDPGEGAGMSIVLQSYETDGSPSGAMGRVNTTIAGDQDRPDIGALPSGRFMVAWQSADTGDGSGTCIRARVYDNWSQPAGNDFIVNTTTSADQANPVIAVLPNSGGAVIAWRSFDTGDGSAGCIRARLFD